MSKLLIQTQVYENYGDADKPHWKAKGGGDYVVKEFKGNHSKALKTVMAVRGQIEQDSEYFREHIIGWEVVADDYLTEFERSQLQYEGKIMYPAKVLVASV
jgi:hypothetical protein